MFDAANKISIASPALYFAPVALADAELLAPALAFSLLGHVVAQARTHHTIGQSWQPLLDGLYLWQVWDLDLPLAVWREEVVTWIYGGLPATRPGQAVVLPARYKALCAAHKLWLPSPTEMNIPLVCGELAWEDFLLSPWGWYDPQTRLKQLAAPVSMPMVGSVFNLAGPQFPGNNPGQALALATLIKYAVATYGRERLPVLLAGFRSI